MHKHTHTHIHARAHSHTRTHIYVHARTRARAHTHTHTCSINCNYCQQAHLLKTVFEGITFVNHCFQTLLKESTESLWLNKKISRKITLRPCESVMISLGLSGRGKTHNASFPPSKWHLSDFVCWLPPLSFIWSYHFDYLERRNRSRERCIFSLKSYTTEVKLCVVAAHNDILNKTPFVTLVYRCISGLQSAVTKPLRFVFLRWGCGWVGVGVLIRRDLKNIDVNNLQSHIHASFDDLDLCPRSPQRQKED